MLPSIGQPITDLATGEQRFTLSKLLHRGDHYDVALGEDLHLDGKPVCIKAIRYDNPEDPDELELRRAALEREIQTLTFSSHLLPEPLDWLTTQHPDLPESHAYAKSEPLLVYEYQNGSNLRDALQNHPEGFPLDRAIPLVVELAQLLAQLHANHLVFRDLSPDHVILGFDDILHVVGASNITPTGKAILAPWRDSTSTFIAPEIRAGDAPALVQPHADIYALGALFAFLITGRDPTPYPEAPLDQKAYHLIGQHGPGAALLLARMLHANPKKRFASIDALLSVLSLDTAINPAHPELAGYTLPSPWSDEARGDAPKSSLSPGPLVSKPREEAPEAEPAKTEDKPQEDKPPAKVEGNSGELLKPVLVFSGFVGVALIIIILAALL